MACVPGVPGWQFGFGGTQVGPVASESGFPCGTTVWAGMMVAGSVDRDVSRGLGSVVVGGEAEKMAWVL